MKTKTNGRKLVMFICIAMIMVLTSACSDQKAQTTQTKDNNKHINIGMTNSPTDLNPIDPGDDASKYIAAILFQPLTDLDEDMSFKPMLADSVETKDNKTFTIKLNKDAKWTDGKPVTSDDVIFTIKLICNSKVSSMQASNFSVLEGLNDKGQIPDGTTEISGLKKIDDKTLELKTKSPISMNLFQNSLCRNIMTVPEHILKDADLANLNKNPFILKPDVSDGPFKLVAYQKDQYVKLEANKDFFRGAPKLEQLNFKILQGTDITVQLKNGEIDMNMAGVGTIPLEDYDMVKSMPNLTTKSGSPSNIQFLFLNHSILPDVKVRQAISYAIDRKMIVDNLLKGEGEVTDSFFTSNNPYLNKDLPKATFDPEKAKQLLKEAGWDAKKVLHLNVPIGNKTREQAADIIVNNLVSVGVNVQIQKMDFATAMAKAKKGDYDITMMGDTLIPIDPTYDLPFFITKGNYCGYKNEKVDAIVEDVKKEIDDAKVKSSLYELQKILSADVPMPTLYATRELKAINKRVIVGGPKDYGTFNEVYKWDVSK